ncbi:hypothetical protein [Erwinia sp.]|uniref:hypothetical protein n=1 Tax=Erwinia citreus TaxID=558 RepID=UPI00289E9059|nr:hypothetical protein [Erwinia sp.]
MRDDYFSQLKESDFNSMLTIVKSEMDRIFGSILEKNGKNLDDKDDFKEYFEDYQRVMTEESFKQLHFQHNIELEVTSEMIAEFILKIRNGSFGFDAFWSGPKLWVKAKPVEHSHGTNTCLIDSDSIERIEDRWQGLDRVDIFVTTRNGVCYKVNEYSIPKLHANNALIEFMNVIKVSSRS